MRYQPADDVEVVDAGAGLGAAAVEVASEEDAPLAVDVDGAAAPEVLLSPPRKSVTYQPDPFS